MEINGIGQGLQINMEANKSVDKSSQTSSVRASEKVNVDDNKNIGSKEISDKELRNAVDKLNKFLEDSKTHAEYQYHDKLKNDLMIKIVDDKTGEVIHEVPPKKILDMVAKMLEMVGVLIDKRA
ncbi:flagellar protein FlaG [Clostridium swellfunianum]|uniref:flagellar protein FlaG n=1 Tax=Clostridium swellfunianum TaxID=1367462 RepID=UPI00202F5B14|nr:flagellar protein FlaG [Clostridium swellfunianum]MCM0650462.1 flagellar protein FlaG [Clostridium swellfunianum]